jgi:imidazolonepropionase-like amidohydrolase
MDLGSLTITNARVYDAETGSHTEGSVSIVDGVIAQLGPDAEVESRGRSIDAGGRTLTAGLIDAHFHAYAVELNGALIERLPLSYIALKGARRLRRALDRGFTTVRDVAGGDAGLAKAIAEGLVIAPRYLYTGAALSQTGGHGDPRAAWEDACPPGHVNCELVDGADALRTAVRERFRAGAHAIKVMTSGGVISLTDPIRTPQYSPEELRAVVDEAERRGSYVAAHAYSPEAIRHSIENGVRSIEHGNLLDPPTAEAMAAAGAYLVPTLAAYDAMARRGAVIGLDPVSQAKNTEVLAAGRESIGIARAAGVPIGFGSDLMGELEDEQLTGFRLQCEVDGVQNALRSATTVNAALLRRPELGRVTPGAAGDLVIWDGDVIEDPSAIWDPARPRIVVSAGAVIESE